jgi:hypothetical protein
VNKGFTYVLEDEKILEYMKLPVEVRLKWLEEINEFTRAILNDRQKEIIEKLRSAAV